MAPKKRPRDTHEEKGGDGPSADTQLVGAHVQDSTTQEDAGAGAGAGAGVGAGEGVSPSSKKLRSVEEVGTDADDNGRRSPGTPTPEGEDDVDSQATLEYIPQNKKSAEEDEVVVPPTPLRANGKAAKSKGMVRFDGPLWAKEEDDDSDDNPGVAGVAVQDVCCGGDVSKECALRFLHPSFEVSCRRAQMPVSYYECTTSANDDLSPPELKAHWKACFGVDMNAAALTSGVRVVVHPVTCVNTVYSGNNPCCVLQVVQHPGWTGKLMPPSVAPPFGKKAWETWTRQKEALLYMPPLDCESGMDSHESNYARAREFLLNTLICMGACIGPIEECRDVEKRAGLPLQEHFKIFYAVRKYTTTNKQGRCLFMMQADSPTVSYLMVQLQNMFNPTESFPRQWWEKKVEPAFNSVRRYPLIHMQPQLDSLPEEDEEGDDDEEEEDESYVIDPEWAERGLETKGVDYDQWPYSILTALNRVVLGLVAASYTPATGVLDTSENVLDVCLLKNVCDAIRSMYGGCLVIKNHIATKPLVTTLLRCMHAVIGLGGPEHAFFTRVPPLYLRQLLTTTANKKKLHTTKMEVATSVARALWALMRAQAIPVLPGSTMAQISAKKGHFPKDHWCTISALEAVLRECALLECGDEPWTQVIADLRGLVVQYRTDISNASIQGCKLELDFSSEEEESEEEEEEEGEKKEEAGKKASEEEFFDEEAAQMHYEELMAAVVDEGKAAQLAQDAKAAAKVAAAEVGGLQEPEEGAQELCLAGAQRVEDVVPADERTVETHDKVEFHHGNGSDGHARKGFQE